MLDEWFNGGNQSSYIDEKLDFIGKLDGISCGLRCQL